MAIINDPLDCSDVIRTPNVTNTLLPIFEIVLSESHDTQLTKDKSVFWFNLPFSVVDQKAGTALNSARKESCNGLYQI
nr:MAG TPA: hypothetical protein [Caudoviricetes sp.]